MRPPRIGRPKTVCAEHELPQYPKNPGNEAHHVWTRPNNGFCGCFEERTEITTTTVQWPSQFCSLQNAFSATSFRVIFRDILSHFELRLMRLSQSKLFCPSLSRVEPFSLPHAYVYVNLTSPAASLLDIAQSGNILREQGPNTLPQCASIGHALGTNAFLYPKDKSMSIVYFPSAFNRAPNPAPAFFASVSKRHPGPFLKAANARDREAAGEEEKDAPCC